MKNYLKSALIGLLIPLQALAGLPPGTVKGQSETSATVAFNIQAPNSQATTTAGVTRLIETGNKNILANASFEHSTYSTSWTTSNSTPSADTTNYIDGKKSMLLTLSAQSGVLLSQSVTPTQQVVGQTWDYSIWLKTTLTTLQVYALQGGSEIGNPASVFSDGLWHQYIVTFPAGSGSNGIELKASSSSTGTANVDDAYVGTTRNIGTVSGDTAMVSAGGITVTGTTSAPTKGTTSRDDISWQCIADQMHVKIEYKQTAVGSAANGSGDYLFLLPNSQSFDSNKVSFFTADVNTSNPKSPVGLGTATTYWGSGTSSSIGQVVPYDATHFRIFTTYNSAPGSPTASDRKFIGSTYYNFAISSGDIGYTADFMAPTTGCYAPSSLAVKPQQQVLPTISTADIAAHTGGFSANATGTYTTPAGVTWIEVEMVGGGGGGQGSGGAAVNGGTGGDSIFGTSLLTAKGGSGGTGAGGLGGVAGTVTAPAVSVVNAPGGGGGARTDQVTGQNVASGAGGNSCYGGGGPSVVFSGAGGAGQTGTGGGGAGGSYNTLGSAVGAGGGSGNCVKAIITSPGTTYTYTVGAAGTAGTGTTAGGLGGTGRIIIHEYYGGMNAPILIGSVSSNSSGPEKVVRALATAQCTSGTCALVGSSGDVTVARVSSGLYTATFSPAFANNTYSCNVNGATGLVGTNLLCSPSVPARTTSTMQFYCTIPTSNALSDANFDLICTGAR